MARRAEEGRQRQEAERRAQEKIAQLKRGAKAGDSRHQANLAWAFYKGLGVPKNYPEAFKWATKSASQGSQYAQHALGEMYLTGSGVPKDYRKAVEWFRLCASIGDVDCEKALGLPALQPTLQALAKIERIAEEKRERREAARRAKEARQRQIAARQRLEVARIAEETRQRLEAERRAAVERQPVFNGTGTGFRVSGDGHILTNKHVVTYPNGDKIARCQWVLVHSASGFKKAKILATDGTNDLALLQAKMDGGEALAFSGENASQLDDIIVAGYPINSYLSSTVKITKGVVSSLAGKLRGSLGNDYSRIQFDAAIQPGSSGGPIINEWGNVVGVAVSAYAEKFRRKTGVLPQNINFGIKSSIARAFLDANNIDLPPPNSKPMTKREKVKLITKTTHLVSCWITRAQARKIKQDGKKKFKVSPTVLRQIEALR